MKMRKFLAPAFMSLSLSAVALAAEKSDGKRSEREQGGEKKGFVSPTLRPSEKLSIGKPIWGKEVNGLQAGISFTPLAHKRKDPRYKDGDLVSYHVVLRNVSKTPITISYATSLHSLNSNLSMELVDEKDHVRLLDIFWSDPPPRLYSGRREKTLAPDESDVFWLEHVPIKMREKQNSPGVVLPLMPDELYPGKYKIFCRIEFEEGGANGKRKANGAYIGKLETPPLEFEVVAGE